MQSETRYAQSGGVNIAYQVAGDGPTDLVFVMGWISNIEYFWQEPQFARFLERLASFSRVILFDKRGMGLSDRVVGVPGLEQRMDDLRAVMDAAGSRRATLLGVSEAGAMCMLFAATYPERTSRLVLLGCVPRRMWSPDFPWGAKVDDRERRIAEIERVWGSLEAAGQDLERRAPSVAHDPWVRQWWSTYLRMSASPSSAAAVIQMNNEIDVRPILSSIHAPTLVIHRSQDRTVDVEIGRYMAERIPDTTYVELPGEDHLPFFGDQDAILAEVERFVTGTASNSPEDRRLLTLLVVDVIGHHESFTQMDDQTRQEAIDTASRIVRAHATRFQGRLVGTGGGRFTVGFDGPARAIRCGCAVVDAITSLSIDVRAGVHAGECQIVAGRVVGPALQAASQIAAYALTGDVAVSNTVKDLVAGSDLFFEGHNVPVQLGTSVETRIWRVARGTSSLATQATSSTNAEMKRASRGSGQLSRREREVAMLITHGLTNRQIGEELSIATSTAERHVINILNKLGYHSRTQIAAWAILHGSADEHKS